MTDLIITRHAETRMSQRGFRKADLEVLLRYASDIGDGRLMLTGRDARRAIGAFKRGIAKLERLTGKVFVTKGDRVITAYHLSARSWTRDEARRARRRDRARKAA